MYEKIKNAIAAHVKKHRLVFWYDEEAKHRDVLEELDIPGEVIEVSNNEWWIKYHILKERPNERFLIYAPHARPADEHNWLLDLVLAGFSFSHDLSETYREELGLGPEFRAFIREHLPFFQNHRERFEPLQELVNPESETVVSLGVKMMGILTAADAEARREPQSFGRILFALVEEALSGASAKWDTLQKYGLASAFRSELGRYVSAGTETLEPDGAAIALFREAWALECGEDATRERRNSRILLQEWKDQFGGGGRYREVAKAVQKALGIKEELKSLSVDQLAKLHLFPLVDSELAGRLVAQVTEETADWERIRKVADERRSSYWVRESVSTVGSIYALVVGYVDFERALRAADLSSGTAEELSKRYIQRLSIIDRLYRNCLSAYRATESLGSLTPLIERLEGRYLHQYLQLLSEAWDKARGHQAVSFRRLLPEQRRFFDREVAPYLERGDKVVVIVSDALRYEAGKELQERLAGINRVSAEIEAMVASVPTVTAVGMNALLPHQTLSFSDSGELLIDGQKVSGIDGRSKVLADRVAKRFPEKSAKAFWARDIANLPATAAREKMNGLDLVYLYSNGIDAAADNAKTEFSLPEAVESELDALVNVVRKLGNQLNRTHILITADHGFLYQSSAPEDMHLIAADKPSGGVRERRFVLGGDAPEDHFFTLDSEGLGIETDQKLHFAEGLYRIRKQGGGNRYVHGGLTLQELIIPLLRVRIGRSDDLQPVSVAVMKPTNAVITTPTYTVSFFQEEPVSEKRQQITLRAFFVAMDGPRLSDSVEITFSSDDPNAQNRGVQAEFNFTPAATKYNGQMITLKLERMIGGATVKYAEESYRYQTFGERDF